MSLPCSPNATFASGSGPAPRDERTGLSRAVAPARDDLGAAVAIEVGDEHGPRAADDGRVGRRHGDAQEFVAQDAVERNGAAGLGDDEIRASVAIDVTERDRTVGHVALDGGPQGGEDIDRLLRAGAVVAVEFRERLLEVGERGFEVAKGFLGGGEPEARLRDGGRPREARK